MTKNFRYMCLSDIHLGHRKTNTSEILNHLYEFFDHFSIKSLYTNLDAIFIAGDTFDRLLDFSSKDVSNITLWLYNLMNFCKHNNIILRILEGTPSHDWKQSAICNSLYKMIGDELDFKYIPNLHIELLKESELYILYVPDEWTSSTLTTYKQVRSLMDELNISKVDIAIMHGLFNYQLPKVGNLENKHDEASYLSIVNHFINIGHIHTFSTYDRIIAQGSFDRLAHNEEDPKGIVICDIGKEDSFIFIENKLAKKYVTIDLKHKDISKCYKQIDKLTTKIPEGSYIRIRSTKDHPLYIAFDELKLKYFNYNLSKINTDSDVEDKNSLIDNLLISTEEYIPITITKENVIDLLMTEIDKKFSLDSTQRKLLIDTLGEAHV